MWKIVLFVLALSYMVLMIMLRSVLLPLKAVIMNLLSVGAAYGVLVDGLPVRVDRQPARFRKPGRVGHDQRSPLIFAIVFGLSMDYEVFLMSRIRERYLEPATTVAPSPRASPPAPARSPRRR